jgi:hypothetical protein
MSSVAFAENPSDNVNETTTNDDIDILKLSGCPIVYDHYNGPGCENPTCKNIEPAPFVNYTDTYTMDAETGKYIPLGEVTKPLPQYMVMRDDTARHHGWGLTYEDIMFGSNVPEHSLFNYTNPYKEIMVYTEQNPADLNIDYTDTYTIDCETGKFIPLGEVTKPLPENMVMYDDQGVSHTGCGLTYEDIMNYNYKIHPLK